MERVRRMRSLSSEFDAVQAIEQTGVEVYLGQSAQRSSRRTPVK